MFPLATYSPACFGVELGLGDEQIAWARITWRLYQMCNDMSIDRRQ